MVVHICTCDSDPKPLIEVCARFTAPGAGKSVIEFILSHGSPLGTVLPPGPVDDILLKESAVAFVCRFWHASGFARFLFGFLGVHELVRIVLEELRLDLLQGGWHRFLCGWRDPPASLVCLAPVEDLATLRRLLDGIGCL